MRTKDYDAGFDRGVEVERERVVAWLRDSGQNSWCAHNAFPTFSVTSGGTGERIECRTPVDADEVADAIERGEHMEATDEH